MQLKIWIVFGFVVLVNTHYFMAASKKGKQASKSVKKNKIDLVAGLNNDAVDATKLICVPVQIYDILPDPTDVRLCAT